MTSSSPTLSPAQERTLLDSLCSASTSLPDLARSLGLSVLDLLEAIASPLIQSKLVALEQAAAHAIRVCASCCFNEVLDTLTDILESERRDLEVLEHRTDEAAIHYRRHERANSRRAATTILRLTRFAPLAPNAILQGHDPGGASARDVQMKPARPHFSGDRAAAPVLSHAAPHAPARSSPPTSPHALSPNRAADIRPASPISPMSPTALPRPQSTQHAPTLSHPTSPIPHPTFPRLSPAASLLRRAGAPSLPMSTVHCPLSTVRSAPGPAP